MEHSGRNVAKKKELKQFHKDKLLGGAIFSHENIFTSGEISITQK